VENENAQASQPEQASPAVATENNAAPAETPVEKATETEATGDDDAPATETEKPKPKRADGGFQRRISELTREFRDAQRREAEANRRADELLAELRSRTGAVAKPNTVSDDQAPKQEDFASYEAYIDARAEYRARQVVKTEREQSERAAAEARTRQADAQGRETLQRAGLQAAEKFPDFEEVVAAADIPVTPAMIEVLSESDIKPELMYWLAKNPDEARSIAAKSATSQARIMGQIEERLRSAPPRKAVTDAPEPPRTVKGKGMTTPDPDKMDMATYRKWRESQAG